MKKEIYILTTAAIILTACNKPEEPVKVNEDGSVDITAVIDSENGTKATLAESDGAFAFTRGDAIAIGTSRGAFSGSNVFANNEDVNTFRVYGLDVNTDVGLAAYPANIVTAINRTSVTFNLPSSYSFSEVGSTDPNACLTPVPMIGSFDGPSATKNKVTFKQAGSVVRFKLTVSDSQIGGAGYLIFTFGSNVTGSVTLSNATPGSSAITSPSGGPTITVSISNAEWTTISGSSNVFVTLPVPSGITIDDASNAVVVTFTDNKNTVMGTVAPASSTTLSRADGFKAAPSLGVSAPVRKFKVGESTYVVLAPGNLMAKIGSYSNHVATASEWKFGGPYEFIGDDPDGGNYLFHNNDSACEGKWVDLFSFQGASASYHVQGLFDTCLNNSDHTGTTVGESLYTGCWTTSGDNQNPAATDYIHISNGGNYDWRPMTSAEWIYLISGARTGAIVNGKENVLCGRAQVAGVNGLLLFPDSGEEIWNTTTMGDAPYERLVSSDFESHESIEYGTYWRYPYEFDWEHSSWMNTDTGKKYTASQMVAMQAAGIIFLPAAGCRDRNTPSNTPSFPHMGVRGYYWSSNSSTEKVDYAYYMGPFETQVSPNYPVNRYLGRSVRLVREVTP